MFFVCEIEEDKIPSIELYDYFEKNKFLFQDSKESNWKIKSQDSNFINLKIEAKGTQLKNWTTVQFFAGIKTGFNDAFHIDEDTKNKFVSLNRRCSEIIKPLLRGKDIKNYQYYYENWYIINSHNGVRADGNSWKIKPIDVVRDYPEIYEHLKKYKEVLEIRGDKGWHWTNLRNCAFLEEFEKPKIVWIEISDKANYAYDENGMYLTNSAYFLSGENLKYLLALLNSKLVDFYFFQITAKIAGGRKRYTKQYIEQIPIPKISEKEQQPFIILADKILAAKRANPKADTSALEREIDRLVYALYGLTAAEVALVEGR